MKTASFQYKCRKCGIVYSSAETSENNALPLLLFAMKDMHPPHLPIGLKICKNEVHNCSDTSIGISDLIGCDILP